MLRRTIALRKWTGPYYDQSKMPVVKQSPRDLKWLWKLPDPPAYPKTLARQLDDGSTFHQLTRRKPLYEYVDTATMPADVVESTLPPLVHDRLHGPYGPRQLTSADVAAIAEQVQHRSLIDLAVQFQCSREQIKFIKHQLKSTTADTATSPRYSRIRPKWSWWFKKKYAKAHAQSTPIEDLSQLMPIGQEQVK